MPPCYCETGYCDHPPGLCSRPADPDYRVDYIGHICNPCAQSMIANGGAEYVHATGQAIHGGRTREFPGDPREAAPDEEAMSEAAYFDALYRRDEIMGFHD